MRQLIVVFAALSALGGYAAAADTPALSKTQIDTLASEIMEHTPEHVHFAEGTTFSWVLFEQVDSDADTALTTAVIDRLKKKYTVYRSEQEIPPTEIIRSESGKLLGYRDGFSFRFSVKFLGDHRVEVRYSDWEGNLAASSQTISYQWTGSQWETVSRGSLLVS